MSRESPSACSGDMYAGLPFTTPIADCVARVRALAMPKSASFTSPWCETSTLLGQMSRWTIPSGFPSIVRPCAYASARQTSAQTYTASEGESGNRAARARFSNCSRVHPSTSSSTMK